MAIYTRVGCDDEGGSGGDGVDGGASTTHGAGAAVINVQAGAQSRHSKKKRGKGNKKTCDQRDAARRAAAGETAEE